MILLISWKVQTFEWTCNFFVVAEDTSDCLQPWLLLLQFTYFLVTVGVYGWPSYDNPHSSHSHGHYCSGWHIAVGCQIQRSPLIWYHLLITSTRFVTSLLMAYSWFATSPICSAIMSPGGFTLDGCLLIAFHNILAYVYIWTAVTVSNELFILLPSKRCDPGDGRHNDWLVWH